MSGINKAILIGHLGQNPDTRYMANGDPVCNFSLATSEKWRDRVTGETKEATEWHKVVCYRGLAKIAEQYLHKGSKVYIEGKIKTRKWMDKEGHDRYTTEIVADEMTLLDSRPSSAAQGDFQAPAPRPAQRESCPQHASQEPDDDIPF